ncbi:hypothetical protein RE6C_04253 [Rhodopirellula europaea 6C]|uniref:Uncharacterized protein n=1 Tax=Rhodopirellula europaea 6C TaxID=1263867 RepID=M2ADA1_9BACT|nr:hypothetical protein RE6C_04253 [Rhodopirellula europaea 6C]
MAFLGCIGHDCLRDFWGGCGAKNVLLGMLVIVANQFNRPPSF